MKKYIFALVLGLLSLVTWAQDIPDKPNPPRLVNDMAGALSPGEQQALEQKLVRYNDTTSTQFAIVLVNSYNGYDPADYTFELGNKWGIGQKGKNNGLLITVAIQDRKYFIATGYGLEGSIPDAITRRVGDQYFKPNFRAGNYYQGLDEATTYLASLPADEFKADRRDQDGGGGIGTIVIVIIAILILSAIFRGGRGNRGRGVRGGGMFFPPFITLGRGGSSWGGGGSSCGGGGGFGGFGGGSFGGGGSGGSW